MAISPQQLTIYLYSAHRAVIFAIAQHSCLLLLQLVWTIYGCVIWNLTDPGIEHVCSAGIRRVWGLPRTAHNNLLPPISCQPPLCDVIAKRFISYVQQCLTSDCDIVNYVVQYGIWFGRMASPVGCSVQHCCNKYGFYRAMHFSAKRGIAIACRLSVSLSVCLSVTLVDCDHIGWNSSKIISPLVSLGCSLFATLTYDWSAPRGTPLNLGPK